MKIPHLPSSALLVLAAFMTAFSTGSAAVLTLEFADGNGTTSVDQYQGVSGSGWTNAWAPINFNGGATSATVLNTTPLVTGGGNYLETTLTSSATGSAGGVARTFDGTDSGVNVSLDHSYSFNLRVDTIGASGNMIIFNNTNRTPNTGPTNSWAIRPVVATSLWEVFNGNNSGGGAWVNTTMAFTADTTYSFTINVDEATNSYVTIIDDGSTTYTSGTLGFRTSAATDGTSVNFAVNGVNSGASWGYSLDSFSVIPEPSSYALLALGLISLALLRRGTRFSRQAR